VVCEYFLDLREDLAEATRTAGGCWCISVRMVVLQAAHGDQFRSAASGENALTLVAVAMNMWVTAK
jgi:hypothetical protein